MALLQCPEITKEWLGTLSGTSKRSYCAAARVVGLRWHRHAIIIKMQKQGENYKTEHLDQFED